MKPIVLLMLWAVCVFGQRSVAITIDDLPRGGGAFGPCKAEDVRRMTSRLLAPFQSDRIPVIGFVNEGRCLPVDDMRRVLQMWLDAGAELGNHTYSHPDLNRTPIDRVKEEIARGEAITRPLITAHGGKLRYFRHPFLRVGLDLPARRAIEEALAEAGYTIAPVTLDNSDYMFAAVYGRALANRDLELARRASSAYVPYMESIFEFFEKRSVEVVGREFPQILLLHASELNADQMPALLAMMRKRGYKFVTLEQALADPAYRLPDTYAGTGGFSWIHRWSKTKGMEPKGEPEEPAFIAEEYRKRP